MSFFPKSRIVVPIDFSPPSIKAIAVGIELAQKASGVFVLHVIPATNPASPAGIWGGPDIDDQFIEKATSQLEAYLKKEGFEGVTACVRAGSAGQEISDYVNELSADLLVIPSHGESGIKRALIGSVTERVIRHAECPALVLRD